ncbi:hypothetical protein BDN72DRAFT_775817 [Pluteus cervinus]|uniref:Uncharacterized protein n=1 Tax=Pluteus cervinus TaxID=181527 RepID=A0ACD3AC88_9AGAR|nr:hypothetical protein BDN72DRAFT_775817 [Pluteus cervinus]
MRISGESRLLVTASIPAKPERVVFRLESCDQGWADENPIDGPYAGSYTWIEAFIYRPDEDATDAPAPQGDWEAGFRLMKYPEVWVIQRNKRADSQYRSYEIVWTKDTDFGWDPMVGRGSGRGFVQTLRPGDRIGILACAQYAGWVNYIKCAEVEVVF